jgi:hypothetical protein
MQIPQQTMNVIQQEQAISGQVVPFSIADVNVQGKKRLNQAGS